MMNSCLPLQICCLRPYKQRHKADETFGYQETQFASWQSYVKCDDGAAPQQNGIRYFSLEELIIYTDNFSTILGEGSFGKTYKGDITNGIIVAIKRAHAGSLHRLDAFKNEIELLSRVHHKNIVNLLGFCFEQGERMLIYEYISNGTLRNNLQEESGILDWKRRLQIALDSAKGLAYLHELSNPQIIHRDINSGNIMLDENLNAKITDFYLSSFNRDKEEMHVETTIVGTFGYLDPDYICTGKVSEKNDVFSFGVVMLELMTGKPPFWGHSTLHIMEAVKTAIDPHDEEYYGVRDLMDPKIVNQARNIGLRKFVQLALACVEISASNRPTMLQVMKDIDVIMQINGSATTTGEAAEAEMVSAFHYRNLVDLETEQQENFWGTHDCASCDCVCSSTGSEPISESLLINAIKLPEGAKSGETIRKVQSF